MINARQNKPHGFALIATISLLILLAILAIGMLSLSSVALRSDSQGLAQAEARANARMALMIAIGELQKQMGPDQRISANGAILSDSNVNHPMWMGCGTHG
jgi:type II secretory pathway component PulK